MYQQFVARVRKDGKITIPKEIRGYMAIGEGDLIEVSLKKPMWWDMLDWDNMGQKTWNMLSEDIKNIIRNIGKAPKFDKGER